MARWKVWQKLSLAILVVFGLLYVGVAVASWFVVTKMYMPKIEMMTAAVHARMPEILSDLKRLDEAPIFADSTRTKDAQEFISRYIGMDGPETQSSQDPHREALLELRKSLPRTLDVETLQKLSADPRIETIDVSWVDELESFDHWNPASPLLIRAKLAAAQELSGIKRMCVVISMPLPRYTDFQFATLIRLLQLRKSDEVLKGLKRFRQGLFLAHTTSQLIGVSIATNGLELEHKLVAAFDISAWPLIDRERIAIYKRVSWAWGGLIHLASWGTLPKEFDRLIKPQNGACATVIDKAANTGFRDFLSLLVPFETDFSVQLKQSEEFVRRLLEICSLPEYLFLLEPSPPHSNPLLGESRDLAVAVEGSSVQASSDLSDTHAVGINLGRVPFIRRVIGMLLMTIAQPGYLQLYDSPSDQ